MPSTATTSASSTSTGRNARAFRPPAAANLKFAAIWKRLPKVVFSTTLSAVQGNARLATSGLAEEIEWLREPGEGNIAIGGATLAAEAATWA